MVSDQTTRPAIAGDLRVRPDGRLSVFAAVLGGLWSADVAVVAVIAGGITIAALIYIVREALA